VLQRDGKWFVPNQQGSTLALTDASGNVTQSYGYRPFGELTNSPTDSNPFQFTGRENDGTGLMYYRARYYAPEWGRFISEDPAGFQGGINAYVYAENNPISNVDPSGLAPSRTVTIIIEGVRTALEVLANWMGGVGADIDPLRRPVVWPPESPAIPDSHRVSPPPNWRWPVNIPGTNLVPSDPYTPPPGTQPSPGSAPTPGPETPPPSSLPGQGPRGGRGPNIRLSHGGYRSSGGALGAFFTIYQGMDVLAEGLPSVVNWRLRIGDYMETDGGWDGAY
jgi:RHS repeat-associated protein